MKTFMDIVSEVRCHAGVFELCSAVVYVWAFVWVSGFIYRYHVNSVYQTVNYQAIG